MFHLHGKRTITSIAAQMLLDHSGMPTDPLADDSLVLTLYRIDPLEAYPYLIAHAGLRQPEPMYGTYHRNDFRYSTDKTNHNHHPLGFQERELTVGWKEYSPQGSRWQLFINERKPGLMSQHQMEIDKLVSALTSLLGGSEEPDRPLYPDLWYQERLGRDTLRDIVHKLRWGASLEDIGGTLAQALKGFFQKWLPQAECVEVGIYLKTPSEWQICGTQSALLPQQVMGSTDSPQQNAFDWVAQSGCSLLLDSKSIRLWGARLAACGYELQQAIRDNGPQSGICIVPLGNPQQQEEPMGIILLMAQNPIVTLPKPPLLPAHVYLLSRLAMAVPTYMLPLMIPGFHWLPDAKMARGRAKIDERKSQVKSQQFGADIVYNVVKDLMLTDSSVIITTLKSGRSTAEVFRLDVRDKKGIPEVPRILKLGKFEVIEDEIARYYRYAHNKRVGGTSRVDVARAFAHDPNSVQGRDMSRHLGAIVYMFAGAGEQAQPWSEWATSASPEDLDMGFAMLLQQLLFWYDRKAPAQHGENIVKLMIEPLVKGIENHLPSASDPTPEEVQKKLEELTNHDWRFLRPAGTCVVHGDLHSDNVFAILSGNEVAANGHLKAPIRDVALIDWGSVRSGRHPLSDISKLVADLAYRVAVRPEMRPQLFKYLERWCEQLGCDKEDWKFAMIHQVAKMLFYRQGESNLPEPYFRARAQAWKDLKQFASELLVLTPPLAPAKGDRKTGRAHA